VPDRDRETRERLLAAAMQLFAAEGFSKVTVRDICDKARANVAAVNYHFKGKVGLYDEVVRAAVRTMQDTTEEMRTAGEGQSPERQLETSVRVFLTRVGPNAGDSWIHQLMMQELADPTPALDVIVEQVLRPRLAYVSGIIAAIMKCPVEDERVDRCLLSVQSQLLAIKKNPVVDRLRPGRALTPDRIDTLAAHIARFSIAGIKAVGKQPEQR
jgi:TetR/AcrR family transcriptional regulator, regulator of cefoperazone and chloramphenicol sensitivity